MFSNIKELVYSWMPSGNDRQNLYVVNFSNPSCRPFFNLLIMSKVNFTTEFTNKLMELLASYRSTHITRSLMSIQYYLVTHPDYEPAQNDDYEVLFFLTQLFDHNRMDVL